MPVTAQDFSMPDVPVLTVEPERMLSQTQFGQRIADEIEAEGTILAQENRKIESKLAEEESQLTVTRSTMPAEEFRVLADAFDARVQAHRAEQDAKARALALKSEAAQRSFLRAVGPILEQVMIDKGASVILDRRAVFLSANAADITDEAIERIDAALGSDGPDAQDAVPSDN